MWTGILVVGAVPPAVAVGCRVDRRSRLTNPDCSPRPQTRLQRRWWDDGVALFIRCWIDEDTLEENLVE